MNNNIRKEGFKVGRLALIEDPTLLTPADILKLIDEGFIPHFAGMVVEEGREVFVATGGFSYMIEDNVFIATFNIASAFEPFFSDISEGYDKPFSTSRPEPTDEPKM